MNQRRFAGLFAVLLVVAAGCNRGGETGTTQASPTAAPTFAAGSFMAELQQRGEIKIGVKYDVPQFGFFDVTSNKAEGMDVDLGNIIAERLGVKATFSEAVSTNRIPFLQNDTVDLIISTMTINEERKQQIAFSNVYYVAKQRLLVAKDSTIKDVDDLDSQKATVCSAEGSTSEKNIRIVAPNATVVLQKGYSDCFQQLQNKQVQAVTTDDVILTSLLSKDPANFKLTGEAFTVEPYGMGIKKERTDFVEFVNEVLTDIKEDGTWVKLYNKWVKPLTKESAEPPPDEVAAEAASPRP